MRIAAALALAVFGSSGIAAGGARAPTGAVEAPRQDSVPWSVGERLEYRVKFGPFSVGWATLQVLAVDTVRGDSCFQVQFIVHGHALFYRLDDSMRSWFGVNDMISRRFEQHTNENGRLRAHHDEIFPDRGIWVRNDRDTAATVPEPLDDASFFYFVRTIPLGGGETYALHRYYVAERNPVTISVLGRDTIEVPAGRYAAVAIRPAFRSSGLFGEGGRATIWFSDDRARLPLRIRASAAIGTLDISLRTVRVAPP